MLSLLGPLKLEIKILNETMGSHKFDNRCGWVKNISKIYFTRHDAGQVWK